MAARINATGGDRPLVKDLHRHVLTNVAEKWDDLGYQLLVRPYQENLVNIIRKDYPNNSIDCCKRVLKEWLDTTEDATWDQLISALRSPSVRLHHFADQLEHMLTAECTTSELEKYNQNFKYQIDSPSDGKHCPEQLNLHADQLKEKNYGKNFNDKKHKNESVSTVGMEDFKITHRSANILPFHSVRVVSDPAKRRKLNYEELEDRMKTFKLTPQWDGPVEYQIMAEAGFVYTGQEDLVFCFSCNIKLDRWSKDMEPLLRHKEESPTCSFMRQRLQAVKGERGKAKSVVTPSKPLNSHLTSSIGQLQSSSLVASKAIHTIVTGSNEPRLSYGGSFDDRRGASLPITPENYQSEAERLKSFVGWPLNEAVHPEQLARVGFVYTGDGALVQCFQCGVKYRHWYKGDVPLSVHQKCNPRCSFLQTVSSKIKSPSLYQRPSKSYIQPESLPIGSNSQGEFSKHSLQFFDYSDQAIRLQSFKHWGGVLPAHELAEAGFYMIARHDVVRCHSCNVVVQDWEKSDNVVDEHRRLSPNCCFLQKFFSSSKANEVVPSTQNTDRISLQNHESSEVTKGEKSQQLKSDSLNMKYPPLSIESKGLSKASCDDDNQDHIPGMHYPPSWWSNPPRRLSENSDESLYSPQSQNKKDYKTLTSLDPPKTKVQVKPGELQLFSAMCGQLNKLAVKVIAALKQQKSDVTTRHSEQIENLTVNVSQISSAPVAKSFGVHTSDLAHFKGNIRSLQNSFDVLACQIDALNVKVEENTETVGTLQTAVDQCTKATTQVSGMVNEVVLKVLAVRNINGILIWKVNEVEKRIEEAKTGKILSLCSPPFFTSLHGYRMCLRLYLNGDGQGKGTHVSLFLVIMKSDYDDFLLWPFKQKVTLYLLNQQDPYNTKAHIAQAFRPTKTSTSFQKPKGPFNTASGFPKFAPVEKLRDRSFVQDDCVYFKVKIDMTDIKAPDYPAY